MMTTATATQLLVIDADAHVIETERTWDYLEPAEQAFRPRLFASPDEPGQQYWVIENKIRGFRFPTLTEQQLQEMSQQAGRELTTPQAAREVDDVALRLSHLDELGIDIQVLHNTLWIEQVAGRPDIEAALCRSWNRWMADVWKQGQGRLRWSCVVPTMMLDEAIEQIRTAKANGAVAVCMRPIEGQRSMVDPYFYPLYEEASRLDLAIAVHIANGSPAYCDLYRHMPGTLRTHGFALFRVPTVVGCYELLMSEVPQIFPNLRWGFIEASAQWVPWICNEIVRRYQADGRTCPDDVLHAYKIFVTCQTDDDIPWLLKYAGDHSLIIGTDYGHIDPSSEIDAISVFKSQPGISQETKDRILYHNPMALYRLQEV
ncbi:amidohydrolase family protein [Candidatus Entotheonella palauensis]|uniref:amidohydrolase family protein n=1 Tax=Candidatus Entotheonella palauensis TaxID=93172 RepID=UPI000B7EB1F9|nr:amidohydrolase family protein [Candidatus Entotheonella palauensis]